jgi:hypothetical protein
MKPAKSILNTVEKLFVDRDGPLKSFRGEVQIDNTEKHVYFISGPHTIGKSWFVLKLYNECSNENWLTVWIDFSCSVSGITDYVSILKEVHLELGKPFSKFQEETNNALQIKNPVFQIQTGEGNGGTGTAINGEAHLDHVTLSGQSAARDIINVNINNFYEELYLRKAVLSQACVISRITEAFFDDLVEYVGNKPIIFFFDDIGKDKDGKDILDSQTRRWLIEDFVSQLCERLPSARFVITQEGDIDPTLQTALFSIAKKCTLKEFGAEGESVLEIYQTYLNKNGIQNQQIESLRFVHKVLKGRPDQLAFLVEMMKGV